MKISSIVARYLLGLMFTVFGLNGFLNFIHQPPPANPLAIQFFVAVSASHFAAFFFAAQVLGGLLLLSGYFVPLALTVLAAELYNILAFHLTLAPASIPPALVWPQYCGYWSSFSTAKASRRSSARSLRRSNKLRRIFVCIRPKCFVNTLKTARPWRPVFDLASTIGFGSCVTGL
jgi:putative oxidoreductase